MPDPAMLRQLLDSFAEKENLLNEETAVVEQQIQDLYARIEECRSRIEAVTSDREKILAMQERYAQLGLGKRDEDREAPEPKAPAKPLAPEKPVAPEKPAAPEKAGWQAGKGSATDRKSDKPATPASSSLFKKDSSARPLSTPAKEGKEPPAKEVPAKDSPAKEVLAKEGPAKEITSDKAGHDAQEAAMSKPAAADKPIAMPARPGGGPVIKSPPPLPPRREAVLPPPPPPAGPFEQVEAESSLSAAEQEATNAQSATASAETQEPAAPEADDLKSINDALKNLFR